MVTILTSIRQVPARYLVSILTKHCRCFLQSTQPNSGLLIRLGRYICFLYAFKFIIRQTFRHSTLSILRSRQRRNIKFKGKGKVHPRTGYEGPVYFFLSLTSALDGVDGNRHAPAALLPGKTRYPLCGRLGGLQGRAGQVRKICHHWVSIPGPSSQ